MRNGVFFDKSMNGHTMVANNMKTIYENKNHAYDIGLETLCKFTDRVQDIDKLQRKFIYDESLSLPDIIEVPWNIDTWEEKSSKYQISTKIKIDEQFNFFTTRRNGLLRNIIIQV
mgnify:FL=1